jgi:hypothetical protein
MAPPSKKSVSVKLLRAAFTSEHFPKLFSGRETHDPARDFIAQLVAHTTDPDLLHDLVRSGLPAGYSGNTLKETREMIAGALRKGFQNRKGGQRKVTRDKSPSIASKILELVQEAGAELFHDPDQRPYISVPQSGGAFLTISLRSEQAESYLRERFFRSTRGVLPAQTLRDVLGTLYARAVFDGPKRPIAIRLARSDGAIYLDLGRKDVQVVRVDREGWTLTTNCPVKFWRPAGFGELPTPISGGDLHCLRHLLALEEDASLLVLAFLISSMRAERPFFCLLVDGVQGSGKSVLCAVLKRIIDPSSVDKLQLPDSTRELMIQARSNYLLGFDNTSGMKNDISDALCRLSTGGGLVVRQLYTDEDMHVFNYTRPFVINGIGDFAQRPDLIERAILLSLPSMPEGARKTERQIFDEFERHLPGLLGRFCDIASVALRNEAHIVPPTNIRMADAAAWLTAAEPGTGLPEGSLIAAIQTSQDATFVNQTRENPVVLIIDAILAKGPIEALIGDLHQEMLARADKPNWRYFPSTPQHLSNQLRRLKPAMERIGIFFELQHKTRDGRSIKIWREGQETDPARPLHDGPSF